MIKEFVFKVNTGNNIYITKCKVKQESANLFQNNETPEIYLEQLLRNMHVAKQKEYGIWLDDGTRMSDLKITKVLNITWDTATSAVVEKAGEIVMVFI